MYKAKRNDPCPCGSGRKFKRCCGDHVPNKNNIDLINRELDHVHHQFISTVTEKYGDLVEEHLASFDSPLIKDTKTEEVYRTGLLPWLLLTVPIFDNTETIWQRFTQHVYSEVSPLTNNILNRWSRSAPSIYEIISIDTAEKKLLYIEDIRTKETYYIPYRNAEDFIEGSLLIGIVVPFAEHDNFFFTMVTLFHREQSHYINLMNHLAMQDNGLKDNYPLLLAKVLSSGVTVSEWKDPQHEEVADLFAKHMYENGMDDRIIMKGIALWNKFCQEANPVVQRVEPYAAALDYYVKRISDYETTQSGTAELYGTSASTISQIFRQMQQTLNE